MTGRMNWRKAALHTKPRVDIKQEAERGLKDEAARFLEAVAADRKRLRAARSPAWRRKQRRAP